MRTLIRGAVLAGSLAALPAAAHAHLVSSGLGPFYDGALHLLLSPADLLGALALGLLAGLRGAPAGRITVVVLPAVWLVAGSAGLHLGLAPGADLAWLGIAFLLLLGLLVAADARLPPPVLGGLAAAYGGLHGLLNGAALGTLGAGTPELLGIVLTSFFLVLLTAAAVVPLQALAARVTVRVVGSWIAAVGMLMLGWLLQGAT